MKIHHQSCCGGAYGTHRRTLPTVLFVAAALLLVVGILTARRDSKVAGAVVHESIVVEAESPRAVVTKTAGSFAVQVSDMGDEVSLLVTGRDGSAIPLDRLDAHASYAQRGAEQGTIALEAMNKDHLMASVNPSRAGTLVVTLGIGGERHEVTFELPFSTPRRRQWDS
jgi:hypothetical protein